MTERLAIELDRADVEWLGTEKATYITPQYRRLAQACRKALSCPACNDQHEDEAACTVWPEGAVE